MSEKVKVLLADDDPVISWGVGRCLTRAGCAVSICGDGLEAIQELKRKDFDVLITDIQMPRLNGLALIEWTIQNRHGMRIVAITAFGSPSVQQVVLQKGAILYLEKPFDPELLKEIILPTKARDKFYGNVDEIDLFDYVQLIFVTRRQALLKVYSFNGEEGMIFIKDGSACHAECGGEAGEAAFYKCMAFKGGTFSTLPWCEPKRTTITQRGDFLLMEAARSKDEGARISFIPAPARESDPELDLLRNNDTKLDND